MPAILLLPVLFTRHVVEPCSTSEPQAHSSLRQDAAVVEATSRLFAQLPRRGQVLSATQPNSQPIVRWDRPLRITIVVIVVVLAVVVLTWVARGLREVHDGEVDAGRIVPETETSGLLGTRVSSSTTLYESYRTCPSIATTAVHTPSGSLRGLTKPVLQPLAHSNPILEGCGDYIASPVEGTHPMPESLTGTVVKPLRFGTRGRASAVTQKAGSIDWNSLDRGIDKSQTQKPDNTQSSEGSGNRAQIPNVSSVPSPNRTNGQRAQTAPCTKVRSSSLAKSLTGLVSIQQATVRILAVGISWEGIGDGSRALPGPRHDIEWLQNIFAHQKNFRFNSLFDHDATLGEIRQSLQDMLSAAEENDPLVLYFSGHGQNDSFELYNSASLNDAILNDWIVEFRSTRTQINPVYIIFDFCRPDLVKPNTELANGVNVIWACSPTESALDLGLKDPYRHLPRSCFLLSLILAIDDFSEDPEAPVVERFTNRMKELIQVIRGIQCFDAKCKLPWRYCPCETCSDRKLCIHKDHKGGLPFQVVSMGGIGRDSDLSVVVEFIASRFPLHIKRAADLVSKNNWVLYFNPSHISANRRPVNPRNHRLGMNFGTEANTVRNMTIPVNLVRF